MFRQDFTCPALLVARSVPLPVFRVRGYHPLWPAFPDHSPEVGAKSRRLIPFRSPLLSESRLISVPPATEMFQFSGFAPRTLWIQVRVPLRVGFPIRTSPDQSLLADSSGLFAGCHVLHRL